MFKKLLKHDFKSAKRFGVPILLAIAIVCIIASIDVALMNSIDSEEVGFLEVFVIITLSVSMFAAMAAIIGSQIIIYENFYKTLLTDEGYLTFTLPVKAKDIIFSKMVNGVIWTLIIGVATIVAIVIVAVVGTISSGPSVAPDVPETVVTGYDVASSILGVLLAIISYFATQLLYFVLIFAGANSFGKDKPSKIVLCILGANFALSTVSSLLITFITFIVESVAEINYDMISIIMLILEIVIMAGLGVGMFFLLKHLMEKKLNLP